MDIGFIGLGSMGRGMARNLLKAGHRVSVFNRSKGPAADLAREGALKAQTPAAVGGDVVVTMLSDGGGSHGAGPRRVGVGHAAGRGASFHEHDFGGALAKARRVP